MIHYRTDAKEKVDMQRRKKYSFYEKKPSRRGRISLGMAIVSFLLFPVCVLVSFLTGGGNTFGNALIGGISLMAVLMSVYGFAIGMLSLRENDTVHFAGVIGSLGSGVSAVLWLTLFLKGIS